MKTILNVSNHILTKEQLENLEEQNMHVVEMPDEIKTKFGNLNPSNYIDVCNDIIEYAKNEKIDTIHLAGFMPAVVYIYSQKIFTCLYAYSKRESVETTGNNGEVIKKSIFKHLGFYKY